MPMLTERESEAQGRCATCWRSQSSWGQSRGSSQTVGQQGLALGPLFPPPSMSATVSPLSRGLSRPPTGKDGLYLDLPLVGSGSFSLNVNVVGAVDESPTQLSGLWALPRFCLHFLFAQNHLPTLGRPLCPRPCRYGNSQPGSASPPTGCLENKRSSPWPH